jgi:uracil-DNA glycosylase family 4
MIIGKNSAEPKKEPKDKLWKGSLFTLMPLTNIRTGKIFRSFLKDTGFNMADIFITNAVKCNAGNNIFNKLYKNCSKYYLEHEMRRVRPSFIITLGDANKAIDALLDKNEEEDKLDIPIDPNQFKTLNHEKKLPFRGKFANGVKSEIYFLIHPARLNGKPKEDYIKNLKIIAKHIGVEI